MFRTWFGMFRFTLNLHYPYYGRVITALDGAANADEADGSIANVVEAVLVRHFISVVLIQR